MLRLIRGIPLTIDPQQDHRLLYGTANSLEFNQMTVCLWITLGGRPDPDSGFIVNVCDIDEALKQALAHEKVCVQSGHEILFWAREVLTQRFKECVVVELKLDMNERLTICERQEEHHMIQVTKKYEVAAAHRLHNHHWDDEQNVEVFGKCNNTEGHGHNYQLEITLTGKPDPVSGQILDLNEIDRVVKEQILDRFDHKYLNKETEEFAQLNPTVENMCQVFWEILTGRFGNARLMKVGVWETPKTYAEYRGPLADGLRYSQTI